jgi:hypothetical protein
LVVERRTILNVDVNKIEAAEASLDQFIERRAREKADANRIEEGWAISERRHRERRRGANRQEWREYEMHMARLHASLSEEHRAKAERLIEREVEAMEARRLTP